MKTKKETKKDTMFSFPGQLNGTKVRYTFNFVGMLTLYNIHTAD